MRRGGQRGVRGIIMSVVCHRLWYARHVCVGRCDGGTQWKHKAHALQDGPASAVPRVLYGRIRETELLGGEVVWVALAYTRLPTHG